MLNFFKNLFGNNYTTVLQQALDKGAVIIDVRTPGEYSQGHNKGAQNIPLNEIKLKSDIIKKWGKPVITVCRSGSRSLIAKNMLTSAGIESYNGGAWTSLQTLIKR